MLYMQQRGVLFFYSTPESPKIADLHCQVVIKTNG